MKRKSYTDEQYNRAKKFGLANGYVGLSGGWIYSPDGKRLCQGWGQLYHLRHQTIKIWEKSTK